MRPFRPAWRSQMWSRFSLPVALIAWALSAALLPAGEPLFRLDLAGRTLEGTPLAWSEKKVFFLARDGQLTEFGASEATNYSQVAGGFHSYSQGEIRGLLLREFGQGYEVSGVGHYLVVHPAG